MSGTMRPQHLARSTVEPVPRVCRPQSHSPHCSLPREQPPGPRQASGAARREAPATYRRPPQPQRKQSQAGRPRLDFVVLVEGLNDLKAVQRAVDADVYVLGSATRVGDAAALRELRGAAARPGCRGVVVLTDPDVAGRQARNALDDALGGCWHAFVPEPLATAAGASRHHEEGNVGVEHAAPDVLRRVLAAPRPSDEGRAAFTREALMAEPFRLIAALHERGGDVNRRRGLVCSYLGIGTCDGKQLLRQLNRYGFTPSNLQRALAWAEKQLEDLPPPGSSP